MLYSTRAVKEFLSDLTQVYRLIVMASVHFNIKVTQDVKSSIVVTICSNL